MPIYEILDFKKIRKALVYLLCVIVSVGLQNMLFARVSLWGVHVFFLPVLVIAMGMFEGAAWGALLGLAAGYLLDITMLDSTATFLVLFPVLGFAAGFLAEFLINRRFYSYFFLALGALFAAGVCQIVPLWIFRSTPLVHLLPTLLLQTVFSAPFTLPAYYLIKTVSARRREN